MRNVLRDGGIVRYRVRVSRKGSARALTHLAQIDRLRRAVAESGLPAVSDGRRKRPRPRLAFGPAISLGYESEAEYFDLELTEPRAPQEVARRLAERLGEGIEILSLRRIPRFFPSLDASINVVAYEVRGPFPDDCAARLERFLARKEIIIEKLKDGGKRVERVDARPLIRELALAAPDRLRLTLRFGPKRTVKPEAVLRSCLELGPAPAPSPQERAPEAEPLEGFLITRKDLLSETARGELLTP